MIQEVLQSTESIVEEQLHFLRPIQECWQPSDFLPVTADSDWSGKVSALQKDALGLSDEVLVVLIGNLITEEALPSYQTWLNRPEGMCDETGASQNPWAKWTRGWTAEENRHGDLLNRYLYLSGRVNMRSLEVTTQHLIRNGFDTLSGRDPYKALVYASFQERATKISHANTGRAAQQCGDSTLSKICAVVAGDEARHEEAYKRIFGKLVEIDAPRAVIAFAHMMRQKVAMPARFMEDGSGRDLFSRFAVIAQKIKVYTMQDYAEIMQHLIEYWNIASLRLSGPAAQSQEYVCALPARYSEKASRIHETVERLPQEPFDWLFGRKI